MPTGDIAEAWMIFWRVAQTVRSFGSSLGLAVLGTTLILRNKANIESSLSTLGIPKQHADAIATPSPNRTAEAHQAASATRPAPARNA